VENLARDWRADFCNWRALAEIRNSKQRPTSARHGNTQARQSRARFSTGERALETLAKLQNMRGFAKCATETAAALLLLLVLKIRE
jgi:hypothetical protein